MASFVAMDGHIRNNPSWMQFVRLLHCRTREAVLWGKREEEAMLLASGEDGQGGRPPEMG